MMAWGYCWDTRVYAGLRQFHKAKGFEPCSQDLARHLGHPLFQLSSGVEAPFVYEIGSSSDVIESLHDEPIHEFTTNKFRYLQLLGLTSLTKVQWMVLLLVSLSVFLKLWL
ncbi:hypothetical protein FB451DRAFT_791228 [Mycena latifolia]|nr:hypothetical protein FB451DRAFT_791228 [Mycena latifolia]